MDVSQLKNKKTEFEFNSKIIREHEEKMNTSCLFKEYTCSLKTEGAKKTSKYTRKIQI